MFEITYIENALPQALLQKENACYDFTFEEHYHIYHRPKGPLLEYITYDEKTGTGSFIFEKEQLVKREDHLFMIPQILESLRYTGDSRPDRIYRSPDEVVELIFRVIMPRHGYAVRESQIQMAKAICSGLSNKKVTLCEAEVGSGKTMAYLVAGFAAKWLDKAYRYQGNPVTVTTSSIELQKAIVEKELPALSAMLAQYGIIEQPLSVVVRKGKEHYFCPHRYDDYMDSLEKYAALHSKTIQEIKRHKLEKNGFDLDKVPLSAYIKDRICVKGSCRGCKRGKNCRYAKFLSAALSPYAYDFQITNHNLFLTAQKAKVSAAKGGLLPFNFCIVDEAHKLPETAADVFTSRLSFQEVDEYLRSVKYNTADKSPKRRSAYKQEVLNAIRLNNRFQSVFSHHRFSKRKEPTEIRIHMSGAMERNIAKLVEALHRIGSWFIGDDGTGHNTALPLLEKLTPFLTGDNNTYWLSYDRSTRTKYLSSIPVQVDVYLQKVLWDRPNTHYALTSGTLQDDSGFSFFKRELGITGCLDDYSVSAVAFDSPFDFAKHTRLYISEHTPVPDTNDPKYIAAVAREVVKLVRAAHGHTAVLFTSYKALMAVYDQVEKKLAAYQLFKMGRNNRTIISEFKRSTNGVLFASGSMWEGVDCPGDILSAVIIVRLPFPLRTHTLDSRREQSGSMREFIQQYAVPKMIIKLRQGAGRLIRTETDTGIVAILDARAARGGAYRSRVLKALRKYPLAFSVKEVACFMDSVKDSAYRGEGREALQAK